MFRSAILAATLTIMCVTSPWATTKSSGLKETADRGSLTGPASTPFHLEATVEKGDGSSKTQIEMDWENPLKWRRTIRGEGFSQIMVVNQEKTFEEDSNDYFPVWLRSAIAALVSPGPASDGLRVQFAEFRDFTGKRVPRFVSMGPQYGEGWQARITELRTLHDGDKQLFSVTAMTPSEKQIRIERLREEEFQALAERKQQIIWPQVLDGAVTGTAQFYVSIDRTGAVREAYPVRIDNERAYESACRQIKRWKFKPAMRNGVAGQAESILSFPMNTRGWGPRDPLGDEEARKLASNTVEPVFPHGTPAGTVCTLNAAIDSDGQLIEVIGGNVPPGLSGPCYAALQKWQFKPFLENGEPRPYRAEIRFVAR